MARFLALEFLNQKRPGKRAAGFYSLLGLAVFLSGAVQGQTMVQSDSTTPTAPAPATAKAPDNKKAPAAATTKKDKEKEKAVVATANPNVKKEFVGPPKPGSLPVPDTFNRYGKIWAPSDDVAHPIKLIVQFPGVGEMKIPSQDELNVRDKLEQLAVLSDDEIRAQLALWPPYAKMKLADEGQLLIRIQQFKEQRTRIAMDKARELGLVNSLTPDQKAKFEKEYWDKRLQMDHELAKQFGPIMKAREQKLREDLFREFSTAGTVVPPPPVPKPPAPTIPLAQANPGAATNAPAASPDGMDKSPVMPIGQSKPMPGGTPPVAH